MTATILFIAIVLLLFRTHGWEEETTTRAASQPQSDIVGGMNAIQEEFSCHGLLDTTKDKLRKPVSGWPLIHSARAATAAQCFEEKQASDFALYFARIRFPDFEHETGFSVLIIHR